MGRPRSVVLATPRFETRSWSFAGLRRRHRRDRPQTVDEQWSTAAGRFGEVPDRLDGAGYGLVYDLFCRRDDYEVVACVAAGAESAPPRTFEQVRLPHRRYVVFGHRGPARTLPDTIWSAWYGWLPNQGLRSAADGLTPDFIEMYGDDPDNTGAPAIEIWFPVHG